MQFIYRIKGMHCQSCIQKIQSALAAQVHIANITLNPPQLTIEAAQPPSLDELNMRLQNVGHYQLIPQDASDSISNYYPLLLIAAYLIGIVTLNNIHSQGINWHGWMNQFMAGFFFVFSAFKLLDIRGFATSYATYDLLAKRWHFYGYIYPFLELMLGILYLTEWIPTLTQCLTIIIMDFSSLGVLASLLKKQKFQCACLGTILKVPLSSVTLIEDLLMVAMAVISLIF